MPLTRYPNGVTACSTSALRYSSSATDGDIDCNNAYIAGTGSIATVIMANGTVTNLLATTLVATNATATTLTVASAGRFSISTSTAATFIGERCYIPFTFTSAASTTFLASPFAGNIIDCWVVCDTTPRTCSAFTLYANGTAGTVVVASVATLVYATAIGQQVQPTLTAATQALATGLAIVVTTAGSAANFSGVITLLRTA